MIRTLEERSEAPRGGGRRTVARLRRAWRTGLTALVAVLAVGAIGALSAGPGAPDALATPEVPGRSFVGGTGKLVGRGFPRHSFRFSWRVQQGADTFSIQSLDDLSFSGTTTTNRTLVKLLPDDPSLGRIGAYVAGQLGDALGNDPEIAIEHVKTVMTLRTSAKRPGRRVTGRLQFDVSVSGAAKKRLTVVLKGNGNPRRVLVLDDREDAPGSGPQVIAALAAAGHFPIDGGYFGAWDPAASPLEEVEAVVLLQGHTSTAAMQEIGDLQLADWVKFGGGLVRTERSAYEAWVSPTLRVDQILPVQSPTRDYRNGSTWVLERRQRRNPLSRRMPRKFDVPTAGWSGVTTNPSATVVYRADGIAMLTSLQIELGRVVHVNNDLIRSLDGGAIVPNVLRALVNSVEYVAP